MKKKKISVTESIQNKNVEIHYNEKTLKIQDKEVKIELQGKINCPVLNSRISSLVCSKLMDQPGWPRNIKCDICDNAHCKIYKSIKKNIENRNDKRKAPKKDK